MQNGKEMRLVLRKYLFADATWFDYVLFSNVMTFRQKCEDTPGVCEYLYREFD